MAKIRLFFLLAVSILFGPVFCLAQEAPGKPGATATWTSGHKLGVGTAINVRSKVWYTLGEKGLTEVYFPRLDTPNLRNLDFIISDGKSYHRLESKHAVKHETTWTDKSALSYTQLSSDGARWELQKTYTTDPNRNTLLVQVSFRPLSKTDKTPYRIYALIDPAIANSGMHDTGYSEGTALIAQEGNITLAVTAKPPFVNTSTGFAGVSDGWTDITEDGTFDHWKKRASDGNIVQLAQLGGFDSVLAFGFGEAPQSALEQAQSSLRDGFVPLKKANEDEWHGFVKRLPVVNPAYRDTYTMAAMVLLAHEDKTFRGASIASISIPWGDAGNADDANFGGYHLVWSRDLYQVACTWLALGDKEAAGRALDYLFNVQQKTDGSFPQNSWLDGRPFWNTTQMDEAAYPLILAWQLERFDDNTWRKHVRPAAEYLLKKGPATEQERWEEEEGLSPSTIAAEIAGLVCAADIARKLGKNDDANRYLKAANEWASGVEDWCYTTTGPLDAGERERGYYYRIGNNKNPNDGFQIEINNGAGKFDERAIVDAGFLELVRLGIKAADDSKIVRSLAVIDKTIKVETPGGPCWYRYNHDGYGERLDGSGWDPTVRGTGRLWTLLTGERGEYAIAKGEDANLYAKAMQGLAGPTGLISEQVWDRTWTPDIRWKFGKGTGSATPLAWSEAQFIRLVLGIEQKRIVEMPEVVRSHFQKK